ncbi:hypothetical protein C8R45DRAFT_1174651 [Mycena sanguinolenta]|nr:hypothetical protein C8R45DRAFT_1174651 [Mycena sanguinolenta]
MEIEADESEQLAAATPEFGGHGDCDGCLPLEPVDDSHQALFKGPNHGKGFDGIYAELFCKKMREFPWAIKMREFQWAIVRLRRWTSCPEIRKNMRSDAKEFQRVAGHTYFQASVGQVYLCVKSQGFLRNQGWAPNRILATTKKRDGWSPLPLPNRPRDFSRASAPYIYGERHNSRIRRAQQQSAKIVLQQLSSRIETARDVRKSPLRARKGRKIAGRILHKVENQTFEQQPVLAEFYGTKIGFFSIRIAAGSRSTPQTKHEKMNNKYRDRMYDPEPDKYRLKSSITSNSYPSSPIQVEAISRLESNIRGRGLALLHARFANGRKSRGKEMRRYSESRVARLIREFGRGEDDLFGHQIGWKLGRM